MKGNVARHVFTRSVPRILKKVQNPWSMQYDFKWEAQDRNRPRAITNPKRDGQKETKREVSNREK